MVDAHDLINQSVMTIYDTALLNLILSAAVLLKRATTISHYPHYDYDLDICP